MIERSNELLLSMHAGATTNNQNYHKRKEKKLSNKEEKSKKQMKTKKQKRTKGMEGKAWSHREWHQPVKELTDPNIWPIEKKQPKITQRESRKRSTNLKAKVDGQKSNWAKNNFR